MSIPPKQITTIFDDETAGDGYRHLAVNRADRGDTHVVVSFNERSNGQRDAIGMTPDAAIEFALALINAAQEVKA